MFFEVLVVVELCDKLVVKFIDIGLNVNVFLGCNDVDNVLLVMLEECYVEVSLFV